MSRCTISIRILPPSPGSTTTFSAAKSNFAADREVAERQITIAPLIPVIVVENRRFLAHAVTWAANQGIRQFIDVGCDMPTSPTTGEVAREVHADARVAYIDSDPVVVSHHLDALLAHGSPGVTVVDGDVRDVPGVLARVSEGVDLSQPACLIMAMLLHFLRCPRRAGHGGPVRRRAGARSRPSATARSSSASRASPTSAPKSPTRRHGSVSRGIYCLRCSLASWVNSRK